MGVLIGWAILIGGPVLYLWLAAADEDNYFPR